ncbi:uncharacterized protein LOC119595069 isoform X2 [Penaeus monodon]|uniref:uncharacterized protein LOC119595069 isoform X2 n=1 Tax=Penaeus monodon TaxID=6687 RepID=UPI0018A780CF|nr:uncharacterized protein LOC119595069 isoform X2 [Penaeus monodon]
MRELNLIDRCVLVVIMLVSTITMTAGGLLMLTEGYTEKALVFLVCGGTTSIFTCAGVMVSVLFSRMAPSSSDTEAPPLPYSDPPPEYRFTWREEYLKKSPESLRTELEEAAAEEREIEEERKLDAAAKNKRKRKDIRKFMWAHGGEVSAVHSGRGNSVGDQAGTSSGDRPRRVRAITVATAGSYGATRPEGRAAPSRSTISVVPLAGEVNEVLAMDDEGLPTYEEAQKW